MWALSSQHTRAALPPAPTLMAALLAQTYTPICSISILMLLNIFNFLRKSLAPLKHLLRLFIWKVTVFISILGLPWWLTVKNLPSTQETWVQYLGWEDPLEETATLQYFCLQNSMDRGTGRLESVGSLNSQTWLSNFHSLTGYKIAQMFTDCPNPVFTMMSISFSVQFCRM